MGVWRDALIVRSPFGLQINKPSLWSPWNTRSAFIGHHLSVSARIFTRHKGRRRLKLIPCHRVARQSAFFAPNTNILHFHYIRTHGGWWLLCRPPSQRANQPTHKSRRSTFHFHTRLQPVRSRFFWSHLRHFWPQPLAQSPISLSNVGQLLLQDRYLFNCVCTVSQQLRFWVIDC